MLSFRRLHSVHITRRHYVTPLPSLLPMPMSFSLLLQRLLIDAAAAAAVSFSRRRRHFFHASRFADAALPAMLAIIAAVDTYAKI